MKQIFVLTVSLSILAAACNTSIAQISTPTARETIPQTLIVFAAASLTEAFTEIGAAFDAANPGVNTTFNFAGSQILRTQIEEGAPVDIFASASSKEMESLLTSNLVDSKAPRFFLTNKLVVILPENNPAALEKLEDLANPGIKIILATEEVPVGKYARLSLNLMDASFGSGFKDKVLDNIVSNEDNVKQVVSKVQLGEADAGIVYVSDTMATSELKSIEIPADLNVVAKYPIAPLIKSEHTDLATKFIEYVFSAEGQAILIKWGFTPVK
ncbi:MAG TPA: molybdate ABC transporter substrate-binding protein [Anaerolineales bacterium]|nr:molybdate ABC transporter substrate-binding protein [Anaerolineales bacterium]HMZ43749.1 molybdate ABC transporter substrate-binding protein [Anaerolineales bacterium]HNA55073.1 molybdate ABC transporter substrate-binding protein [Anaerolineales bacterium]HNO85362.1 molybdate ABC transporter substrate-binding protein [Anaerolineales bacterium]